MNINPTNLFNIPRTASMKEGEISSPPPTSPSLKDQGSTPIFLTSQSFVAFPVSSAAVTVTWKVLGNVFPQWGTSRVILLFIAFIAGILIFYISETEHMSPKEKRISAGIVFFNSIFLAASALGINSAISS